MTATLLIGPVTCTNKNCSHDQFLILHGFQQLKCKHCGTLTIPNNLTVLAYKEYLNVLKGIGYDIKSSEIMPTACRISS
jgi:hypothetical protein